MNKKCGLCGLEKDIEDFYRAKSGTHGRQGYCKECSKAKRRECYHKNAQEINRKEYERRKGDPLYIAYMQNWRDTNREAIRKQCRDYYSEHPELWVVYNNNRKARVRGGGGGFTIEQWLELCELCGYVCLSCSLNLPLTVDHIKPVSKGGSSFIQNIQPLCQSCNARKKDSEVDYRPSEIIEFYSGLRESCPGTNLAR